MSSSAPIFQTRNDRLLSPQQLGLTIIRDGNAPISVGGELWIAGVLALDPAAHTADNHAQWMRSLFVSVTSLRDQCSFCGNLLRDQVLFSSDFLSGLLEGGKPVKLFPFRFELLTVLQQRLPQETYFIEVSARQYRSNILIQDVT